LLASSDVAPSGCLLSTPIRLSPPLSLSAARVSDTPVVSLLECPTISCFRISGLAEVVHPNVGLYAPASLVRPVSTESPNNEASHVKFVVNRTYQLHRLAKCSPAETVELLLENGDFQQALKVANRHSLSTDPVLKAQWECVLRDMSKVRTCLLFPSYCPHTRAAVLVVDSIERKEANSLRSVKV
jgi:hypothetical protein